MARERAAREAAERARGPPPAPPLPVSWDSPSLVERAGSELRGTELSAGVLPKAIMRSAEAISTDAVGSLWEADALKEALAQELMRHESDMTSHDFPAVSVKSV